MLRDVGDADWQNMARQVALRLKAMGSPALTALHRQSEVSPKTWGQLLRGLPVVKSGKPGQIMDALGWEHESWVRVLMGGEPTLKSDTTAVLLARLADHEARLSVLERAAGVVATVNRAKARRAARGAVASPPDEPGQAHE